MLLIKTDWAKLKRCSSSRLGLSFEWEEEYRVLEELFKDTELDERVSFTLLTLEGEPDRWGVLVLRFSTIDPTVFNVCRAHSKFLDVALRRILADDSADYPIPDFIKAAFLHALIMLSDLKATNG